MTSTVSWLDADDAQRRRMREAVELFRQEGTVDELGLGRMRDVISDRLFPGTSVLWRRARYLLFVPWLFQLLEAGEPTGMRGATPEERARHLQKRLALTLKRWAEAETSPSVDTRGIIGRNKIDVWQTPDMNVWAGLEVWGIRVIPTTLAQARREAVERSRAAGLLSALDSPPESIWNPRLPAMPEGFPDGISMELEPHEAEFLASLLRDSNLALDPISERRHSSLMPVLLRSSEGEFQAAEAPLFVGFSDIDPELAVHLEMAACFSQIMRAGQLLYVQVVAEARGDEHSEGVLERLERAWTQWEERAAIDSQRLEHWHEHLPDFDELIKTRNPRIVSRDLKFVADWTAEVMGATKPLPTNKRARSLIVERENRVKGAKAKILRGERIGQDAAVDIPIPLSFRWEVVHNVIADIRQALP